jgi:hypothetical protein
VFFLEIAFMIVRRYGWTLLALLGLALAPSAQATTITAGGGSVVPSATAGTPATVVGGPTVTMMTYVLGGVSYELELTSTVWKDNTLVTDGLTFGWKLNVISSTPAGEQINSLSVQNFSQAALLGDAQVEYVTGSGTAPASAEWSGSGTTVLFTFNPPLNADTMSATMLLRTRSKQFTGGQAFAQGGAQYTAATFAPAIPEPTSMVLAFAGLPVLGLYLRRRARA